jgi:predicted O-methyltransferase YrrM
MSQQNTLKKAAAARPMFDAKYAILSAPVRHLMMMGTVWYLAKQKKKPLDILEIGSWYGASALSWAQGLKLHNKGQGSVTCVDGWQPFFDKSLHKDEVYVEMEKALASDEAYNIFRHNISTIAPTIKRQHLRGVSDNILPLLREKSFDVVFIDADHTYKPVKKDILLSMPLVKEGGIICGDDLNLQYGQVDKKFAKASKELDFTKDPKTGRNFHPGVTLAVNEIFGEVSMWGGFWAMQRKGKTWKRFSLAKMPVHYPDHFPADAVARAKAHLKDISPIE